MGTFFQSKYQVTIERTVKSICRVLELMEFYICFYSIASDRLGKQEENPAKFLLELTKVRSIFKQVDGVDVLTIADV